MNTPLRQNVPSQPTAADTDAVIDAFITSSSHHKRDNRSAHPHTALVQPRIILLRQSITGQGGAENYLRLLCTALAAKKHHVILLTDSAPAVTPPLAAELLRPASSWLSPLAGFPVRAEAWCKKNLTPGDVVLSLDRNRRQHILRAGDGVHAAWLRVRARAGRLTPLDALRHARLLRREKLAFSPERTDLIWANSHWVAAQIRDHYPFPQERIHVIHNGVDTSKWRLPHTADAQLPAPVPVGAPVLLFVGSGWWRKGWDIAVRIHAELRKILPGAWLVGVGKPGRELEFRATLREKNVAWLGPFSSAQLARAFTAAGLLLLPTRYDPFTNVVLEALAAGLPVLTSTENGAAEILPSPASGCGTALPLSTPLELWAAAAAEILQLGRPPEIRVRCRELAQALDIPQHIHKILSLIDLTK
jgi:UDP-glucose:(heptosyl)LPS alpha-1,3-glucosyltransferase